MDGIHHSLRLESILEAAQHSLARTSQYGTEKGVDLRPVAASGPDLLDGRQLATRLHPVAHLCQVLALALRVFQDLDVTLRRTHGFVTGLFSKRRKQLGTIFGRDRAWPEGVTPDLRPEALDVAQLVELWRLVEGGSW